MTAQAEQEPGAVAARRWWRLLGVPRRGRVPLGIAIVLLAVLIAVWSQRRPLAENFIDDELARRGIAASYRVADIGLSSQRLTDLVIGDPADPDLVADSVIVRTQVGLSGARVTGIEAGQVRLRGRLVDGKLSLGALDRLLPAPSGKPFALPEMFVDVADARMRLTTPHGVVGVRVSGRGQLNDGFAGRIAAVSDRLAVNGCAGGGVSAAMALTIDEGAPTLRGPIRAATIDCGASGRARDVALGLNAALGAQLDRWRGNAKIVVARAGAAAGGLSGLTGTVDFAGNVARTEGAVDLASRGFAATDARGSGLAIDGRYRIEGPAIRFAGRARADRVGLAPARLAQASGLARSAAGTPVAALGAKFADAIAQAGKRSAIDLRFAVQQRGSRGALVVREASIDAASGARIVLRGGQGVRLGWPGGALGVDGNLTLGGGGLPQGEVRLVQARPGEAVTGEARFEPYAAGGEALALAPVRFSRAPNGATAITTRMRFSGAFPGGRVDGLTLPIDARWDGGKRLAVNARCAATTFDRLRVSALLLAPAQLALCPTDGALLSIGPGGVGGGASVARPVLRGTIGGTPLRLEAARAVFALDGLRFDVADVAARLGAGDRISRLDIAALDGRVRDGGAAGRFAGASGVIGNVPLNLSGGAGAWRFADGRLTLNGEALRVADAAPEPRYNPLAANDFVLTLSGNRIDASGTLTTPAAGVKVADVTIVHDLGAGAGRADLAVTGISFTEAFQPEALTRLTFGVIADVAGTVSGAGQIRWSPESVTSDGVFRTAGTDLAAAFGPVEGISGEIRFTDLLGLKTAPSQLATIAVANPGIPVENGQVRYQLIGDQKVAVEGGRWPFGGGELVLEPTVLDFGQTVERRMVFRVRGVDGAQFLQTFDFENLNATGTFDGVLPMIFDERGGRIEDGRLTVREGGGTIAYIGELTQEDLGTWGNLAFQALKAIDYDRLNLVLNGSLSGEMVTEIQFAGISQGKGTKSNFIIDRLAKLPLVFNITIRAPFRQLLDSVQSYYDPSRLIERNLPTLIEQQQQREAPPVQPPASENVP
ncbi:YdbH domain-containing protein [Sphingomonas qomolangmaensis]|uniref:YdbH domain-containing protein n=1 Tax=Sphingomonas qomolangmaensis TaxID=2918765 RepID=A0ABY5LAY1_9SPHN|nr:YdbH domain-containing protein [Sphingomonas qomolangmaensis]UUL82803.1 YdbH domain-containing protein [Sphingomonas qomolangmaensis]